jgi:hypothetical protein
MERGRCPSLFAPLSWSGTMLLVDCPTKTQVFLAKRRMLVELID